MIVDGTGKVKDNFGQCVSEVMFEEKEWMRKRNSSSTDHGGISDLLNPFVLASAADLSGRC